MANEDELKAVRRGKKATLAAAGFPNDLRAVDGDREAQAHRGAGNSRCTRSTIVATP